MSLHDSPTHLAALAEHAATLATFGAFLARSLELANDLGVGVVVALAVAVALIGASRALDLHWSWGALSFVVLLLLRSMLGSLAPALAVGALVATLRARRNHLDDRGAGADLAVRAARRTSPAHVVRSLPAAVALRRRRSGARDWFCGEEMIVGRDRRGALVSIPFGGADGGSHTLVVGATGSGKTVTQTWIVARAVERGMGAVVVDPKGDRRMRHVLFDAAAAARRPFVEWSPDGPIVYNPFARGGDSEIADKLLAGERFSEPHYLRQAQRYLGHVVRALRCAGFEVSLRSVVHHLDPIQLERLVRALPASVAEPTTRYLDSLAARQIAELAGVRDRLAIVAESDVGRWLDPGEGASPGFDLLVAARARAIVYFDLAADSRPLLTQMVGAAIVQDLTTTVAALQHDPVPTVVAIDEFSTVAATQIVRLFGRARSAGVSVVLGTQELADLRLPGHESLLEQVLGNLTVLLAHRQVVPASAQLIAGLAGTVGAWRTSLQTGGKATRTRVREGALAADDVTALAPGCAAAIVLGRGPRVRMARIFDFNREAER